MPKKKTQKTTEHGFPVPKGTASGQQKHVTVKIETVSHSLMFETLISQLAVLEART